MSTSTIGQYFSNRVEELISEFTGHTLIFFKGFGLEQIRFLITHPNSLLDDASLLHDGFLDLEAIDDRWLDLAASIKSATKPLVGFYEELLAIRQLLPRMKIDNIVVICAIQRAKKRRNLLISAETFEYLFKEKDVENRTKSGLLLLSKDLSNKYTFPVLIVRPKAMLSKNYVNVPHEVENEFLKLFGSYCTFQQGIAPRTVPTKNQSRASDMTVYSSGKTFLVDMAGIWENCYPDRSFGMFKKEFFERGISVSGKNYTVAPRVRVEIRYSDDYVAVSQRVETVITAITQIFEKYKNGEIKQFSQKQFEAELAEMLGEKVIPHDKVGMLLDIFTESVNEDAAYSQSRSRVRVLRSRKMPGADETGYFVSSAAYARLPNFFIHQIGQCEVNTEDNSFFRFYPLVQNKQIEIMPLLRFMELLGLATYEIRGGEKAEVFIRINDPEKLERLATSGKYTNGVLQSIQEHHRNNERLLTAFFSADMNDDERWELIEQYFLGNEEYVRRILHIAD